MVLQQILKGQGVVEHTAENFSGILEGRLIGLWCECT